MSSAHYQGPHSATVSNLKARLGFIITKQIEIICKLWGIYPVKTLLPVFHLNLGEGL